MDNILRRIRNLSQYRAYFVPRAVDPSGKMTWETFHWFERHHWFPVENRVEIETKCASINFKIDAFVTRLRAAVDRPSRSFLEYTSGVALPAAKAN